MTRSLHDLASYVDDAFIRVPTTPFVPENTVLGVYTFVPWARTGIAQVVEDPPDDAIRAEVTISVTVEGDGAHRTVRHELSVRGPADVIDFNAQQIVRRYPERGTTQAESITREPAASVS